MNANCRNTSSSSGGPPNNCSTNKDWSCGDDHYKLECYCGSTWETPNDTCKCLKNGNFIKSVGYGGCNNKTGCDWEVVPAVACGVPL